MKKWLVNTIIRFILHIILKMDASEFKKIPPKGACIVVVNHVNFLDAPVISTQLQPHRSTGLVKKETWEKPLMAFLFNIWEGIPIDRDTADFGAFQQAKDALKAGKILAIAPEGTRTEDGVLIQGKPGIAMLAVQTNVPIFPIAYYGHEDFKKNLKKLKRTPIIIRVGKPFRINLQGQAKTKDVLQTVTDSVMLEIAALMPEKYHGYYGSMKEKRGKFLDYLDRLPGEQVAKPFGKQPTQPEVSS
jgi:1-acyl-sn-glycerol-3-phosphate acyltransferase